MLPAVTGTISAPIIAPVVNPAATNGADRDSVQSVVKQILDDTLGGQPATPGTVLGALTAYLAHHNTALLAREAHDAVQKSDPLPTHAHALVKAFSSIGAGQLSGAGEPAPVDARAEAIGWLQNEMGQDWTAWVAEIDRHTVACQLACHAFDLRLVGASLGQPMMPNSARWIISRLANEQFMDYVRATWNLFARPDVSAAHRAAGEVRIREWSQPIALTVGVSGGRESQLTSNVAEVMPRQGRLDALDLLLNAVRRSAGGQACILVQGSAGASRFRDGVSKEVVMQRLRDSDYRAVAYQTMVTSTGGQQRPVDGHMGGAHAVRLTHLRNAQAALHRGSAIIGFFACDYSSEVVRQHLESGASISVAAQHAFFQGHTSPGAVRTGPHVVIIRSLHLRQQEIAMTFVVPHTGERLSITMHTGAFLSQMLGYVSARG